MESQQSPWKVAEFFAGAGLARKGLEATGDFNVVWANDIDEGKAELYRAEFGHEVDHLDVRDVHAVKGADLPDVDVAWASFPCTDVSLAGDREGLAGAESGTWWAFHRVLAELKTVDRLPPVIAVENVVGLATSDSGQDLERILKSLEALGYAVDVLVIDARHFVPQSRPRLFVVATTDTNQVLESGDEHETRPGWLQARVAAMNVKTFAPDLPDLPSGPSTLDGWVDRLSPQDERWWEPERVDRFVNELSEVQADRLQRMVAGRRLTWRTAYRRTRRGAPAWEIRADEIAGCLRTVRGGSSKQAVVEAGAGRLRVRWMTPHEYAALMGASDYRLKGFRANQIYFGFGDAVAVPAVRWLAANHIARLLR